MNITLYHYVHCPYCIRVRLALGFLNLTWSSQVLPYDDEKTPIELSGKKMLPILQVDGLIINESLDIIRHIDQANSLQNDNWGALSLFLDKLASPIHSLAMPYWVWTAEFTPAARLYFTSKKSISRGPFNELMLKRTIFENALIPLLKEVEENLQPFWQSQRMTIQDIGIASHLWGLFVVPEFRFSSKVHDYLMEVKRLCQFNYHQDFWNSP